jgi:hypothetical protein
MNFIDEATIVSTITVEVIDYHLIDDANYYQSHVFILQVWIEQNMYKLNRSYAAFVELDYKLRYQYPRSQLPQLPLNGCITSAKIAPARRFSARSSVASSPISQPQQSDSALLITAGSEKRSKKKLMKRTDASEAIGQKKSAIAVYMKELLKVPEILVSEAILSFLDQESIDGEEVEEFSEDMLDNLEISFLLQDEQVVTKIVRSI